MQKTRIVHGTSTGYRNGCRKDCCRDVVIRAAKARRLRKRRGEPVGSVPALGTRRRLLSLGTVGYSQRQIGAAAGLTQHTLSLIAQGQDPIFGETARRMADAFERLAEADHYPIDIKGWGSSGPQRAAKAALAHGGVPPLQWAGVDLDDPDAVPAPARAGYTLEEVRVLLYIHGLRLGQIADDLDADPDSVYRRAVRCDKQLARALYWSDLEWRNAFNAHKEVLRKAAKEAAA